MDNTIKTLKLTGLVFGLTSLGFNISDFVMMSKGYKILLFEDVKAIAGFEAVMALIGFIGLLLILIDEFRR